jgi:hypothetical protein
MASNGRAAEPAAAPFAPAPRAAEKPAEGAKKGLAGLVQVIEQREAEGIKQTAREKQAADQALGKVTREIKRVNPAARAQANALAQQWRPALVVELAFVRLVCPDLSPEQRVLVKAAGEQALFTAADTMAGGARRATPGTTPQAMIREALADALRETLAADEWKRFAAEAEARVKRRQTTIIRLVVGHLDDSLYLSDEQRNEISRSLADHWQTAWESWMQLRYARNLPAMPDDVVLPYLDPDQKQAWGKIPKANFNANSIHINMGNIAPLDAAWWDEGLPALNDAAADVPPP